MAILVLRPIVGLANESYVFIQETHEYKVDFRYATLRWGQIQKTVKTILGKAKLINNACKIC